MRNRARWAIVLVMAVISTGVRAQWNPDTDPSLAFNLNFETHTDYTTTDAKAGLVGTFYDYNTVSNDLWLEGGKIGTSADFRQSNDMGTGVENDCRIRVLPSSVFDLGWPEEKHTYTFWFNAPTLNAGTIIRHENIYPELAPDFYWEIRMYNGQLHFYHRQNCLRMNTTSLLSALGVLPNTWHHAAIVIDRTTRQSSKIYIDGLEVDATVTYYNINNANIDPTYESPFRVGTGEREFDGLLDELRIYSRDLNAQEMSILYQTDGTVKPVALLPIPRSKNATIITGLSWVPASGATAQTVLFGTDPNVDDPCATIAGGGAMNSVTNTQIGGLLVFNTTYYWRVDSTVGGSPLTGPVWSFTTGSEKASNPSPADGAENVPDDTVNLSWTAPSASSFDVYFSNNRSLVETNDVSVRIAHNITNTNIIALDPNKGQTYYWRVNGFYPPSTIVTGDVWRFRTEARLIIINTSDVVSRYDNVNYGPLTCTFTDTATVVTGFLGDDDVAVFNFTSDPNFTEYYDIVVIPEINDVLEQQLKNAGLRRTSRPLAIHVNGNLYFGSKLYASGPDALVRESSPSVGARCGGHRGSFRNEDRVSMGDANMIKIFGPGYGATSTLYSCGAGGGYGSKGGDQARAGAGSGGLAYGYKEIPIPLGGSAGGWSNRVTGGPGGGAVEIAATGNITFGTTAKVLVTGGNVPASAYGAGGGAGGSVKIIAGGSFANNGIIDANGGHGGDTTYFGEPTNPGGGGGGGRVSIFYGTTCANGQITVNGGTAGLRPEGSGSSSPGGNGTIFTSNVNPAEANFPTPADGFDYLLPGGSGTVELKWYPGFGATKNELYFGTTNPPASIVKTINGLPQYGGTLRAQQSYTANVNTGQTYYWYVKTTYAGGTVDSKVWSFDVVQDFKMVFNTSDVNTVVYDGQSIAPLTCRVRDAGGWSPSPIATGTVASDGVAIFNFPSGFNYGQSYNIVVLPEYNYTYDSRPRRPLGINVTGNFYFNGKMDISGDDFAATGDQPKARSGGYRGARAGVSSGTPTEYGAGYFSRFTLTQPRPLRFGGTDTSNRNAYSPTASGYNVFGPGIGVVPPLESSGGGGYGGVGGDSGRGFWFGIYAGGGAYGDKEVPIPFGGSSGGWGRDTAGGAGGGGVEIVATGNVTFGSNAQIYAEGGSVMLGGNKPGGGGAGGSVRVIAGGVFSNSGIIGVNGGKGGNSTEKLNQTAGGGAGGRVAIFYGTTYTNTGQITADGGARGFYGTSTGYASDGQVGTIFVSSGSPRKASAPTPRNGDDMIYVAGGSGSIPLKWYSGYGGTTDVVYFGTNPAGLSQLGAAVPATRGQHTSTVNASIVAGQTYYWKVVTDVTVQSDVWSFKTVNWQCANPMTDLLLWDTGYYYDCFVDFEDFAADLARVWLVGDNDLDALARFAEEWLISTRN